MSPAILALIPAHNEASRIASVVAGARRHLEVLVVDDGSADDTARVAEAAGAHVIRQPANRGKGEALRTGFREALAGGALGAEAVLPSTRMASTTPPRSRSSSPRGSARRRRWPGTAGGRPSSS